MLEELSDHQNEVPKNLAFAGVRTVVSTAEIKTYSNGNRYIKIVWARPDLQPLEICENELETPLFNHALTLLPIGSESKKIAGIVLDVETDSNGFPITIGRESYPTVSIRQTLIDKGWLSE